MKKSFLLFVLVAGLIISTGLAAQELHKIKLDPPVATDNGDYECLSNTIFSQPPVNFISAYVNSFIHIQVNDDARAFVVRMAGDMVVGPNIFKTVLLQLRENFLIFGVEVNPDVGGAKHIVPETGQGHFTGCHAATQPRIAFSHQYG